MSFILSPKTTGHDTANTNWLEAFVLPPNQICLPIGLERATCRGSKITNSLGRTKLSNSLGRQQFQLSTRT